MSKFRLSVALSRIGLMVILMGMTLLQRAYGQQEVDPTWYNPWPAARQRGSTLHASAADKYATAWKCHCVGSRQATHRKALPQASFRSSRHGITAPPRLSEHCAFIASMSMKAIRNGSGS